MGLFDYLDESERVDPVISSNDVNKKPKDQPIYNGRTKKDGTRSFKDDLDNAMLPYQNTKKVKEETIMDKGLFAFMEDTSELKPQGKSDVDYAVTNTPIQGDPSESLPIEKQPDYVPAGYEKDKPENCTDLSNIHTMDHTIDYIKRAAGSLEDGKERVEEYSLYDYMDHSSELYSEARDGLDQVDRSTRLDDDKNHSQSAKDSVERSVANHFEIQ